MNSRQTLPSAKQAGYSALPSEWDLPPEGAGDEDLLDVRALLVTFWRRKWLIAAAVSGALFLALLAVNNTRPQFSATATVIYEPERFQILDTEEVLGQATPAAGGGLQNQVEILRSSTLLAKVADVLDLHERPEFNAALRTEAATFMDEILERPGVAAFVRRYAERLLPASIKPDWLREDLVDGNRDPVSPGATDTEENLRKSIVRSLNGNLSLNPVPGSSVIEVEFTSTDREMAAMIANTIAEQYILNQNDVKRDDVAAVMEMMGGRVKDLEQRLAASQAAVEAERIAISEEQGQSAEMTRLQLDALNQALATTRLEGASIEGRFERAAGALEDDRDLWVVTEFRESPTIRAFRNGEIELLDEIAALQSISSQGNVSPQQTVLQARLAEVRRNIEEEAKYIVAALEFDLTSNLNQQRELETMIQGLEVTSIGQARGELRIQQLEREALANQTIYGTFLSRMNEISEQAKLQTSDARFLSPADVPQSPDTVLRNRFLLAAGGGGLLAGLGLALLLERLNNSYRDPSEVREGTGLPLLAAIPQTGRRRRPKQLIAYLGTKPRSTLAESIRNLRTSVLFSKLDSAPKVVMITSSVPEEGKSATAMLLAVTSRQMGRSAVLVDCDFRQETLARHLSGKVGRPGLVAVLEGSCSVDDALLTEPVSGLAVLAKGLGEEFTGSPADILASQAFKNLIDVLRSNFDLVVLDTPPALVVTDSRLLARLSDSIVYLVRWNHTSRNAVREGLRELSSVSANVSGIAFTMVAESKAAKYSNNEYFYRQGYGSYTQS